MGILMIIAFIISWVVLTIINTHCNKFRDNSKKPKAIEYFVWGSLLPIPLALVWSLFTRGLSTDFDTFITYIGVGSILIGGIMFAVWLVLSHSTVDFYAENRMNSVGKSENSILHNISDDIKFGG